MAPGAGVGCEPFYEVLHGKSPPEGVLITIKRWNPFHSSPAYCATKKPANEIIQIQVNDMDISLIS